MINHLDYEEIKFPISKKIIAEFKGKTILALMYSVMKMVWLILFIYEITNLKIVCISC